MAGPNRKLRAAGVVIGLPVAVVVGWGIGSLLNLIPGDVTVVSLLALAVPIAVYGWFANRWWAAFPLPLILGVIYLATLRVIDARTGGCSVCSEDEDWSNYPYFFGIAAVLPVAFLVLLGVGMRRARDGGQEAARTRKIV